MSARCHNAKGMVHYRSAKLLIDQHGEDAPIFAAMQADKGFPLKTFTHWSHMGAHNSLKCMACFELRDD